MTKKSDVWMPLYIGDYISSTTHLTTEQHGAYLMMMMAAWKMHGILPNDDGQLMAITKLSPERWEKSKRLLFAFFLVSENELVQERLLAELNKAKGITATRSQVGSLGGRPKKQNESKIEANEKQNETPSQSPSQSHISNSKAQSDDCPASQKKSLATGPVQIVGFDYQLGKFSGLANNRPLFESWMEAYPGVDIRKELNTMRAWLMSNPKNRKTNLQRFINNWLSKAQDQASRPQNKSYAEQTQDFRDRQANEFYQPLLNASKEDLEKWGLA